MVQDKYDLAVAYNPNGGDGAGQLVAGATFEVYAVDDLAFASPLTVTDPVSGAAISPLKSTATGVLPPFRVAGDPTEVLVKSGTFTTRLQSRYAPLVEAGFDAEQVAAAVGAVADAEAARDAAVAAAEGAAALNPRVSVRQDFTAAADGALTVADSGQAWALATGGGSDAEMRIVDGRMTNAAVTSGSTKAGHATIPDLAQPVARMGGEFDFTSGSGTGGVATMVAWAEPIVYPGPVPDTATHLTISVAGWTLIHFEDGSGTTISSGVFSSALTPGVSYTAEWAIVDGAMLLTLPDGSTATIVNDLFTEVGRAVPGWETYQTDASVQHRARWSRVWADTDPTGFERFASVPRARAIARDAAQHFGTTAKSWPAASDADNHNVNVPTTEAEISTDLRIPFVVPDSGRVLVEVSAQVLVSTAGGDLRWVLVLPAHSKTVSLLIAKTVADEYHRIGRHVFEGLTPGQTDYVAWRHRAVSPMAATLRANAPASSFCTISVTPLPPVTT